MLKERDGKMPIGVLARRAGVSTATINFYVQRELLPPPEKISRTRALYTEEHLEWLRLIQRLQALGYPLRLIKRGFRIGSSSADSLELLRDIGMLQPIPNFRSERTVEHLIEPTSLLNREEFVKRSGLTEAQVKRLEDWGILRPMRQDRYNLTDLELVAMISNLLKEGFPP